MHYKSIRYRLWLAIIFEQYEIEHKSYGIIDCPFSNQLKDNSKQKSEFKILKTIDM